MGMFDAPQYLTGENGYVTPGDTFYLHDARIDGVTTINGETRPNVKLLVSRDGNRDSAAVVYTSGIGIAGQVKRMTQEDRTRFPMEVRLDAIPAKQAGRNPTNVLTPADQPEPDPTAMAGGTDF